ncbi:L-alanine-DL-glutamate epimerase-like enolase superfamily enzyme [Nocardia transvalensis]|uniref:L-alanine-DL-glutamate epimerase-like enolase superfamily enzyme n=1 Tax=Nocardia transvalensis TaxID=37333 RepID=A0A7W9UK29_9NOCA|nr:enolase C-terminal domain-like protein [Nocardia transvalensis]MBB5916024.1 L-alanine-DL-glutamate epimerase-like enolase superfamily enzyme [Nocardia transvalensis]
MTAAAPGIDDAVVVSVFRFPTPGPEADGTLEWNATTAVAVELTAGGERGFGWTYSSPAAGTVIDHDLAPLLRGRSPLDITGCRIALQRACRSIGTTSVVAHALSAVDIALWDLKARLLGTPLSALFGTARDATPVYGSGGFTNLPDSELTTQISQWLAAGCSAVKIKIGQDRGGAIERDLERLTLAAELTEGRCALMADANGAYTVGRARRVGRELDRRGVVWFEEPVTSDDPHGLERVRASVRCDVTAGEYICGPYDAAALIDVVDCLQLDVTRCGGYSGFLDCAALAAAHGRDVSAHCAPALHAPVTAAVPNLRNLEWFIDHARLEPLLVDGAPEVAGGLLPPHRPDTDCGHGMRLSESAEPYRTCPPTVAR